MHSNDRTMNGAGARAPAYTQRPPPESGREKSSPSPPRGSIPRRIGNLAPRNIGNNELVSGEDDLLTSEELAMLQLVAEGLPLNSVARRMQMSPRTVRRRLRNICDRLGVMHPVQAIAWTARRGLI